MVSCHDMESSVTLVYGIRQRHQPPAAMSSISPAADESGVTAFVHKSSGAATLARSLVFVLPAAYALNFTMAAVLSAAFGVSFAVSAPFDHSRFSPNPSDGVRPLVNWLSFMVTFAAVGPWLIFFIVRDAQRAVDCATVLTTTHFFMCTVVTQRIPENWQWWATVMPAWLFAGRLAEFLLVKLRWSQS